MIEPAQRKSRLLPAHVTAPAACRRDGQLIEQLAAVPIPPERLARIKALTTLIWGRHDLTTPLRVAETAADRHGRPLHVIEDAGGDPSLGQPDAFLDALRAALEVPIGTAARPDRPCAPSGTVHAGRGG